MANSDDEEDFSQLVRGPLPFLDEECHKEHLLKLAQTLTQWKTFAPWLDLDLTHVEDLDRKPWDEEGKRQQMFLLWKRVNGREATYRTLTRAFLKTSRRNLAEKALLFSQKGPPVVVKNASSNNSSYYSTPQGTTPRRCRSCHGTPHHVSGTNTPLFRSTKKESSATTEAAVALFSQQEGPASQAAAFQKQMSQLSGEVPPLQPGVPPLELPPPPPATHTHHTQQQQQPNLVGVPVQEDEEDESGGGGTLYTPTAAYYSQGVYERVGSVSQRAPRCGIPLQHSIEMKELANKVQQLEEDKKMSLSRYESMKKQMDRNLSFMRQELAVMEQEIESERKKYEEQLKVSREQLKDMTAHARQQERLVAHLTTKLGQSHSLNGYSAGEKGNDYHPQDSIASSGYASSRADSEDIPIYTGESFEVTKSLTRSVGMDETDEGGGPAEVEGVDGGEEPCGTAEIQAPLERIHRRVRARLEKQHSEMEMTFVEATRLELANRHLVFLQVNSRIIEVVSESLTYLSSSKTSGSDDGGGGSGNGDTTGWECTCGDLSPSSSSSSSKGCDGGGEEETGTKCTCGGFENETHKARIHVGDYDIDTTQATIVEALEEDLQWLQENLERCRLARHVSCS